MAQLERDIGKQLFLRSGRGARLTAAGERLLPYADRCLALADEALAMLRVEDNRPRVRVAMHATFAPSATPLVLDTLAPLNTEVSCIDAHSDEVVQLLADGAVDFGLVVPCPHPRAITVGPFLADPVICVTHPHHELLDRDQLLVRDLGHTPSPAQPGATARLGFSVCCVPHPSPPPDSTWYPQSKPSRASHAEVVTPAC